MRAAALRLLSSKDSVPISDNPSLSLIQLENHMQPIAWNVTHGGEKSFPMEGLIQVSSLCSALIYTGGNSKIPEACTTPSGWIKTGKQAPELLEAGEKEKKGSS